MKGSDETTPLLSKTNRGDAPPLHWVSLLAAGTVCLGLVSFGTVIGYTSPTAAELCPDVFTPVAFSFFQAISTVGAILGGTSASFCSDMLGRTRALSVACVPFIVGWSLIALGTLTSVLIVGRFLTGIGVGMALALVGVYIAEISPAGVRGALLSTNQLAINAGIVSVFALGLPSLNLGWRRLAAFSLIPPATLLVASFFLPESPRWLVANGRREEAAASLRSLRGRDDIQEELKGIEDAVAEAAAQPPATLLETVSKVSLRRPLGIVFGLAVLQQFSGINAVFFNTASIFAAVGVQNGDEAALMVMGPQIVISIITCFLMDSLGRRPLLIGANIGMAVGAATLGFVSDGFLGAPGPLTNNVSVGAVLLFVSSFSAGMGPIPWVLLGELLPTRERGAVAGTVTALNNGCAFIVVLSFHALTSLLGNGNVFFLYAALCATAAVFTAALLPETKGHTLEEIQGIFAGDGTEEERGAERERNGKGSSSLTSGGGQGGAGAADDAGGKNSGHNR